MKQVLPADVLKRPVVLTSLGVHLEGAARPHPCPKHGPSLAAAFRKRMAVALPAASRALRNRFSRFVRKRLRSMYKPLPPDTDLTFERWIESTLYSRARKEQLRAVHEKVMLSPHWVVPKWRQVDSFAKLEDFEGLKHLRSIYARRDEFKTIVGPLFKVIEEVVYQDPGFIKHIPIFDRAGYIRDILQKEGATYLATDYTAYESHFTADLMAACEFQLYDYMVELHPEGRKVLKYYKKTVTSVNHCVFRNILSAQIQAGRMSGEMTTSLGNGFTNLMIFQFMAHELKLLDARCIVEGDDAIARAYFPPQVGLPQVQAFYLNMGMNVKIEVHSDMCLASFCGLVFDSVNLTNIPDPLKSLLRTGWTGGKYRAASEKTLMELLRGKAMSLMCVAQGCPVLQEFAQYLLRVTAGSKYRIDDYWLKAQVLRSLGRMEVKPVEEATRLVMEKKYKVTRHDQMVMERYFAERSVLGPIFDSIFTTYYKPDQVFYYYHYKHDYITDYVPLALPYQKVYLE